MSKSKQDDPDPEAHQVTTAVRDVAYRLTHDLSDTPEDIGDAVAFAPLAVAKLLSHVATEARRRPKATIALVAAATIGVGLLAASLWRRR